MKLLVIDTQQLIMTDQLYEFNLFVSNIKILIETARKNNCEVIFVRHDDGENSELTRGTLGYEIYQDFLPMRDEKIFDKRVNSAFYDSGLLEYLKETNENELMIVGLQTDYCIDANIKAAFEHGFEVFVPAYANTTVDNQYMIAQRSYEYYNHFIWSNRYAHCISLEEALHKLK